MNKHLELAWRQRGYLHGRYGRGITVEHAREQGGGEAVRAFLSGKRAGERQRELAKDPQAVEA